MTNFDLASVRAYAASIDDEMNRCDKGEGIVCATLDAALYNYARIACEFRETVRKWGRAVFADRVAYDKEVELAFLDKTARLYRRLLALWHHANQSEGPCYILEGRIVLQAALWDLRRLMDNWTRPEKAVAPSARNRAAQSEDTMREARAILESLPPLPDNWTPEDATQQNAYRQLRNSVYRSGVAANPGTQGE